MFVAGLQVNPTSVRRLGLSIFSTSVAGIIIPFGLGFGLVYVAPGLWDSQGHEKSIFLALFIGTAMAVSALPVIARILIDLNLLHEDIGTVILAAAAIDDLIAWSLFAVILNGSSRSEVSPIGLIQSLFFIAVLIAFFLSIGRKVVQYVVQRTHAVRTVQSDFSLGVAIVLVMATAATTEQLGFHAFFGAFLVGVAMAEPQNKRNSIEKVIQPFVYGFFAPLYFVSVGLKANFITNFDLRLVLVILLIASIGKIGGAGLGAWVGRMPPRRALAVGVGLNARGAVGLLLASVALDYKIIDQRIFVALVMLAVVTSISSSLGLRRLVETERGP